MTGEVYQTEEYVGELNGLDLTKSGLWKMDQVDFDIDLFLGRINADSNFGIIPSSDGLFSSVKEAADASPRDNSKSSRHFGLHTDGIYYDTVPPIALLYCVDPGNNPIPTVFADSREIVNQIIDQGYLDTATQLDAVFRNKFGREYIRSLLEPHTFTGESIINTGLIPECRLQPKAGSTLAQREADSFYSHLTQLSERSTLLSVTWHKGTMLAFDNLSWLHGRGLPQNGSNQGDKDRELLRIWLSPKLPLVSG